jgi:SlyX protein
VSNSGMNAAAASTPPTASAAAQSAAPPAAAVLEQRLTELEIKASYADDLLDTLNQLVARQQETLDLLVREVSRLRQQGGEGGGQALRDPRDELPPHY